MASKVKAKKGRSVRTRYGPELLERAIEAAKTGASDAEIIAAIGCNDRTFYRWLENKPDFAKAIAKARLPGDGDEELDKLKDRWNKIEAWFDDWLDNRGAITEECDGDGMGSYTKKKYGGFDARLLERCMDRMLGKMESTEKLEVSVTVAKPPPDDDEEFADDEFEG